MDWKDEILETHKGQTGFFVEIENKCNHKWAHGYTLEPVVFCERCNKDWDEVYLDMSYQTARKLV